MASVMPVHTFSGLGGQNTLEKLCKWAFDHPVNEGAVFIAHNSSNYDPHYIVLSDYKWGIP